MFNDLAKFYLNAKKQWSAWIAATRGKCFLPLPVLNSPEEVNNLVQQLKYTGDGPYGMLDFTQDPKFLYWHIEQARQYQNNGPARNLADLFTYPNWPMIDCDDYAELAYALFNKMGWCSNKLILIDPKLTMSHVVCEFWKPNEYMNTYGIVDTNGLHYFTGGICEAHAFFSELYKVSYNFPIVQG